MTLDDWLALLVTLALVGGAVATRWGYQLGRADGLQRARAIITALGTKAPEGHQPWTEQLLRVIDKTT